MPGWHTAYGSEPVPPLATPADVVTYLPLPSARVLGDASHDEAVIRRLLAAGLNVLTTVGYLYPRAYGAEVVARLEDACHVGRTSLHGTGANPGFLAELLPLTLTSMSARVCALKPFSCASRYSYC